MFETNKLRGRIVEIYGSQKAFAKVVSKPVGFISMYLNGHRMLDQNTIAVWVKALGIPANEIDEYFFTRRVHETEQ